MMRRSFYRRTFLFLAAFCLVVVSVSAPARATQLKINVPVQEETRLLLATEKGEKAAVHGYLAGNSRESTAMAATLKFKKKEAEMAAGTVFRDCADCPEMVMLPPGSFSMGNNDAEADADEKPVHTVRINYKLAAGKYAITRGQYAQFVTESGHSGGNSCLIWNSSTYADTAGHSWQNTGYSQTDNHPVACVNWDDAQAYVKWLNNKTSKGYRLLSETEWEYAARGGTTSAHYWGADQQCSYANGRDATAQAGVPGFAAIDVAANFTVTITGSTITSTAIDLSANCTDGFAYTAPVGSFKPNAFGLYDMLGNVWQWTEDCWNQSYAGAPADGSAWKSGTCAQRVVRGGSWDRNPLNLYAALRDRVGTASRLGNGGFRLARTAP